MKSGYITLPSRNGWCVEITWKFGKKISKILLARDYPTKADVEAYIKHTYGITRDECTKYDILECIM